MNAPTSLRLPRKAKKIIASAARKRGLSTNEFMIEAALKEAARPDWQQFLADHPPVTLPANAARDLSTREGFGG